VPVALIGSFGGGAGGTLSAVGPEWVQQVVHCLWALLAALIGGTFASLLFGGPTERSESRDTDPPVTIQAARRSSLWPAVPGLAAFAVLAFLGLVRWRSSPGIWAGTTFLSTCGLLGMTVLAAVGGQGRRRSMWLGAALFGVGYMTLTFGGSPDSATWPMAPTNHWLNALRRWFPPVASGYPSSSDTVVAANARIHEALEARVPMRFPIETPLEDVLKYIQVATAGPDRKGIPMYVDPIGLQEAEKTVNSTVLVNLEGVPLQTSLRLCLEQLDLSYAIRDGLLLITSKDRRRTAVYQDPFLIVGQCLFALLAAAFGALVAPVFSSIRRESAI
jgi:hypothetical protein